VRAVASADGARSERTSRGIKNLRGSQIHGGGAAVRVRDYVVAAYDQNAAVEKRCGRVTGATRCEARPAATLPATGLRMSVVATGAVPLEPPMIITRPSAKHRHSMLRARRGHHTGCN